MLSKTQTKNTKNVLSAIKYIDVFVVQYPSF